MGAKITDDLLGMDPPKPMEPPPPPPPPVNAESDPATQAAIKKATERELNKTKGGRSSLFLTGPRGVTEEASLSRKVLLGS